jgi:hypothetical protein
MVSFSLDAREVPPDPPNPGTPRVFRLESKVNRIAVAVEWGSADDALHLSRQLPGGTWQEEGTVQKCPDHGFITVDVAGLYGGVASVPETTWRLTHTSAGAEQPIADADVMFFVDLHATGDIVFDKPVYGTGEPMEITARLRVGNQGIRNATVKAEAAGPGESLGTLLATNGPQAIATLSSTVSTVATTSGKAGTTHPPGSSPDPFAVKAAVLNTILRRRGEEELPVWVPPSIFVDGTSELHEDASHPDGPGNYTNVFAQTAREGSYTFRFTIEATLPSGEPYHQVVTLSKWVGVKVDPFDSIFTIDILKTVRNLQYASVKVTPKDSGGQFLGPFRQDALVFNTTAGHFIDPPVSKAPLPAYSKVDNLDGSYTQVLEYPKGVTPVVTVEANGTALPPFVVSRGCLGALLGPLLRLVGWLVRLARRS